MGVDNLQDCSHCEDERADNQASSATEPGCDGRREETAEKGTGLKDGDSIGVDCCFLRFPVSKVSLKRLECEDAACDAYKRQF